MLHEKPYTLGWVSKNLQVRVSLICKVSISIGKHYKEEVMCDVLDMDICHVLLCHPWKFETDVTYNGHDNVMLFKWGSHKIAMAPILNFDSSVGQKKSNFLVMGNDDKELDEAIKETWGFFPIVVKVLMSVVKEDAIPEEGQNFLQDLEELIADELPNAFPLVQDIQH
ncbi:uncharacterized protein LOC141702444 [Apium graveolens]|uniref:uncharacterized protein LOC141702444 n=1 Tax=Apium graveolens TaxID=4045 RepID=UPI003D7A3666